MGQDLLNPPTVEGWHTGAEWIDSGTLVERINFAADQVGNTDLPGIRAIIERLSAEGVTEPQAFVDRCLDMVGSYQLPDETRDYLVDHIEKGGAVADRHRGLRTPRRPDAPAHRRHPGIPVRVNPAGCLNSCICPILRMDRIPYPENP